MKSTWILEKTHFDRCDRKNVILDKKYHLLLDIFLSIEP